MGSAITYSIDSSGLDRIKETLLSQSEIQELFVKIDADHVLAGAGVVYITKDVFAIRLREFSPICRIKPIHVVIHEIPTNEKADVYSKKLIQGTRESKVVGEAVGTVMSCGAAVLGWLVVLGSGSAAPISGGLSAAVTLLAVGAATASSVQCINSAARLSFEIRGRGHTNDYLDSQEWYQTVGTALDTISLAGAGSAALTTFKVYGVIRKVSPRGITDILKGMTRSEKKRLTEEIIRIDHPKVSNKMLKRMIRDGVYPKRYSDESINTALMLHLKDSIGATLSFAGSATSGNVKNFVIGVYEHQK